MNVEVLNELVEKNEWAQLPSQVITREGVAVDTTTDTWNLHYPIVADASIVFSKITNDMLRWCTKKYVYERLQFTSTHAGLMAFHDVWREFLRVQDEYQLSNQVRGEVLKEALIRLVEDSISHARSDHRLWALYRPVQWYLWCAENYSELGFCPAFALELDGMVVPGNPKGEAVRAEDKDQGPLHSTLELPLLIKALREDKGHKLAHLQQKAAVALSIALGRNPANLTYLKISDVVNLTPDGQDPCYVIKMPRIKKRHLNPRDSLLEEYLDPEFARYVCELVEVNKSIPTLVNDQGRVIEIEKPLFIKVRMNNGAVASGSIYDAFNMTSEGISQLIQSFVRRHNIVSPLTGEVLNISARRLRYTLATCLAAEGISKAELARILDHTDTQHVEVYFEIAGNIVQHLDKSMAKGFAKYIEIFRGKIIENSGEAVNGDRGDKHLAFVSEVDPLDQTKIGICGEKSLCHLDPPFSCYLCPKFQPYRHADHEHVMDCLLFARDVRIKKYEQARLGVQLDQVIIAVAQVIEQCKGEVGHE